MMVTNKEISEIDELHYSVRTALIGWDYFRPDRNDQEEMEKQFERRKKLVREKTQAYADYIVNLLNSIRVVDTEV